MKAHDTIFVLMTAAALLVAAPSAFADVEPAGNPTATRQAIQAAIDAAAPTGGTVTLGAGTFEIDAQLMVTNGVTLVGQGWDSTIIKQTATGNDKRCATVDGNAALQRVTLTGGCINGNNARGAGVNIKDGTVSWCRIYNNTAGVSNGSSVYGGGVGFYQGKGQVDHSIIESNLVNSTTALGGGVGIYQPSGPITIDTCLVVGNAATGKTAANGKGGGVYIEYMYRYSDMVIRNSTITGNSASGTTLGGGLYVTGDSDSSGTHTILMNDIMVGNTSAGVTNDAVLSKTDKTSYCLFGLQDEVVGTSCFSGNPAFSNVANGDYHLTATSPAIDAGATYEGLGFDLDNVAFADPPAVGCYEYGERAADPEFAPAPGSTFYPSASVTLSCATEGASIYYTTDGSVPTDSGTLYTAPIVLDATTTIKARAYATGKGPSGIVSATYTFKRPVPKPDQFRKSVEITLVTNLSSTAITTGIPALVRLDESTIVGFHYDDFTLTNGGDMMFVDENGEALPHEVDTWDTSGKSLVWVKLPSTAANTKLTMYYGNGTVSPAEAMDVWGDYVGVWHLNEANGNARDSTGHGLVAVPTGADAADSIGVASKIGNGRQMATAKGKKSYLSVANSDLLDCGDSLTFSGWFKASATFANYSMRYVSRKNAYTDANGWEVEARYGTDAVSATTVSARGASQGDFTATVPDVRNNWIHLALVFNGKTLTYYVNGIQKASHTITAACSDNDLALVFGNSPTGNESNWCGWMDELRLSDDPMSPEYAGAQYAAMNVSATDIFAYGAATGTQAAGAVISVR